jgi:hypothetical protein
MWRGGNKCTQFGGTYPKTSHWVAKSVLLAAQPQVTICSSVENGAGHMGETNG